MKIKVLLVDDEKQFVDVLAERLETRDFDVTIAYSGDEALEAVKSKPLDVVVLDVLMPGKDGVEALVEIKKMKPILEVIMLTGNATVESAVQLAKSRLPKGESLTHCEECEEEIPEARRKAMPGVRLCVRCQSELEKQQKTISLYNRSGSKDSQLK